VEKHCTTCGKPLPPDFTGEQCSLCRVGLAPVRAAEAPPAQIEYEGRVLSGMFCPSCSAELSIADLTLGRCAICNSVVSAATAINTPYQPLLDELGRPLGHASRGNQKVWPEDAPLW
jgi:hypothetical protein